MSDDWTTPDGDETCKHGNQPGGCEVCDEISLAQAVGWHQEAPPMAALAGRALRTRHDDTTKGDTVKHDNAYWAERGEGPLTRVARTR